MDKENLNSKAWYRAIKVLFFLSLVLIQISGFFLTPILIDINGKEVNPSSFEKAGKIVKQKFPEYNDISDEDLGKKIFSKELSFEQFKVLKDRGFTVEQISSAVEYKNRWNTIEKISFYIASFIIVSIIFYLIARIFFYIILGEKFFSLKKIQQR